MTEILIALFGCEGGKQRRCVVLPTKLCHHQKTRRNSNPDVQCRLCAKIYVSHILPD